MIKKIHTITSNGKSIQTTDNRLNKWVRSVDDGKLYKVDQK